MANDLIEVLLQLSNIVSITVVGIDHEQLACAKNSRLKSFPILEPIDINSDLLVAIGNSKRIAIFLPDLPSVKPSEISLALELASDHETSFISDQSSLGTTAFFSSVGKVPTYFGTNSAATHRNAYAFELVDPHFIGIKSDCDDLSDLLAINSADLGRNTRYLIEQHQQN